MCDLSHETVWRSSVAFDDAARAASAPRLKTENGNLVALGYSAGENVRGVADVPGSIVANAPSSRRKFERVVSLSLPMPRKYCVTGTRCRASAVGFDELEVIADRPWSCRPWLPEQAGGFPRKSAGVTPVSSFQRWASERKMG